MSSYEANSIERNAGYQIAGCELRPHSLVAPKGAGGLLILELQENIFTSVPQAHCFAGRQVVGFLTLS